MTRWGAILAIVLASACGGGSSDEWVFSFVCLLGEGEVEERRATVRCGAGEGQACTLEAAEVLARRQVPETCGGVVPSVIEEPTECPGCP